ncbi:MAG: molybdenum cofactor guanylyltransferase [Bradymonadaceae bacterium]|nr:molybdenum cofactor guanylyltransferase [Lujinxingiaceae bacterium]
MNAIVPVYITAGGASSRFGRDKARAVLPDGRTLIEHVATRLQPVASTITVVADRPAKFADLGFRTIADLRPGLGPLSGLHAALEDVADDSWLFYVSCDFLGFDHHWVEQLVANIEPGAGAVAFRSERWEPVFALYNASILKAVAEAFAQSEHALWRLLDQVSARALPLPADWHRAKSINTKEDLDIYWKAARAD